MINFGCNILYSHHPEKLYDFLSFLFDVEAYDSSREEVNFQLHGQKFIIKEAETKRISKATYFTLEVDSIDELNQLKQNIDFYYYKENQKKFQNDLAEDELNFSDTDGRQWSVLVGYSLNLPIAPLYDGSRNVRNF